jgi:putative transposase
MQICDANNVQILKEMVSRGHIRMSSEYPLNLSISDLVKCLRGESLRRLQLEYSKLKKCYWIRSFWAIGYEAWSTWNIADVMVQEYLEHDRDTPNVDTGNFII